MSTGTYIFMSHRPLIGFMHSGQHQTVSMLFEPTKPTHSSCHSCSHMLQDTVGVYRIGSRNLIMSHVMQDTIFDGSYICSSGIVAEKVLWVGSAGSGCSLIAQSV